MASTVTSGRSGAQEWRGKTYDRYLAVRGETERRAALLSEEDQILQSMADASPTKWHRAHTTWFFEEFVLKPNLPDYRCFHPHFGILYNSYYVGAGPRSVRPQRGLMSRPSLDEIAEYRAYVDAAIERLVLSSTRPDAPWAFPLDIGLNHEQQHQELILTDILHALAQNPLHPAYDEAWPGDVAGAVRETWLSYPETIATIGKAATATFAYDNETPAHRCLLQPFRIRCELVTNREWLAFMQDGGYLTPTLWLSDGWNAVERYGWNAPGYWQQHDETWMRMTLGGMRPVELDAPVCHVSYYEADAFARWVGKQLPSEFEWERAVHSGRLHEAFGVVWQWTRSAYSPYPGYRPAAGTLGEYNGKFMINQMVLRGSSLATPAGHSRPSYRNFFYPDARWQFTGLRLCEAEN